MKIPTKMKCIQISSFGAPEMLKPAYRDTPLIKSNEILIKVKAAGVNRPDIMQRKGQYPSPPGASDLPGLEVSGKIVKIGGKVRQFKIDDSVCALTHGGGYAEYCKVNSQHALKIPKSLSYIEAAGIPETFFTVWANVFDRGKLKKNETLLIHGGSSGIGTSAIQMAKAIGAEVFVTAGNTRKCNACLKLGATKAINYNKEDFQKKIIEYTKGNGVDLILDIMGSSYFEKNISSLKNNGRLSIIALQSGYKSNINLRDILIKRITITASTLRPRTDAEKAKIARNVKNLFWHLLEKKKIKPLIYKTFRLEDASKAHRLMETSKHIGKIILKL